MPDLTPSDFDPELTSRLGKIVIKWAGVEAWLSNLLATMVDANPGAMSVVTNEMSGSMLIQVIRTMLSVHEHKQPELAKVQDLLSAADDIRIERNELIHGIWDPTNCEPGTCLVNTINWKRAEITRNRLVTVTDLNELMVDLDEWIENFIALGKEFGFPRRAGEAQSIFSDN